MENVFEEMLAESTAADETEQEENDFDHSFDLSEEDLADPEEDNSSEPASEVSEEPQEEVNITNNAFAQMRTENKQFSERISEIDSLVKSLGMKDIDDFVAKAKEAQIQKEAKEKGIPQEFAQEIAEMRELKNSIVSEREQAAVEAREKSFVSNVEAFIESNKLSKEAVDKISQDMEKDGLDINALMDMPKAALNKILSTYAGTNYQKNLERKDTIRKELPINQSSKIDNKSLNKDIDDLAKMLAGKN